MALFTYLNNNPDSAVIFILILICLYVYDAKAVVSRIKDIDEKMFDSFYKKEELYSKTECDKKLEKLADNRMVATLRERMDLGFKESEKANTKIIEQITKIEQNIREEYMLMNGKIDELRDRLPKK